MVSGLDQLVPTNGALADGPSADDGPRDADRAVLLRLDGWHVYARPSTPNGPPGRVAAQFVRSDGELLPVVEDDDGALHIPFALDDAYRNYVGERWVACFRNRRVSTRQLALFYRMKRFVPRWAQLGARRVLVRWQGTPSFPAWPLDDGVRRLVQLHAASLLARADVHELGFRWFWPDGARAALVLSHDVEVDQGVALAIELADLEESLGFRSSFNFGAWYRIDHGVLRELTSRGFEVGMHGLVHDRSLFSSRATFERSLPRLDELAQELGAVGFRSPSTHRVVEWLAELPIEYDGTVPHSDPYEPQPGGCCSLWPFFVGDVVELPYTLPQDHTLLTLLGHRTAAFWIETANEIVRRHGLVHSVSHPDRGYLADPPKRAVYAEFLAAMREVPQLWHALPRDVAAWWRARDDGSDPRISKGRLVRGESPITAQIVPPGSTA